MPLGIGDAAQVAASGLRVAGRPQTGLGVDLGADPARRPAGWSIQHRPLGGEIEAVKAQVVIPLHHVGHAHPGEGLLERVPQPGFRRPVFALLHRDVQRRGGDQRPGLDGRIAHFILAGQVRGHLGLTGRKELESVVPLPRRLLPLLDRLRQGAAAGGVGILGYHAHLRGRQQAPRHGVGGPNKGLAEGINQNHRPAVGIAREAGGGNQQPQPCHPHPQEGIHPCGAFGHGSSSQPGRHRARSC